MNSILNDPNNHVPEISQGDEWGDILEFQASQHHTGAALPPRRSARDPLDSPKSGGANDGICIDLGARTSRNDASGTSLEVREISADVLRLQPEADLSPRPPKKVVFHEKPKRTRPDIATAGEGRQWGQESHRSHRWMLAGGGILALLIVIAFGVQPIINRPTSKGNPMDDPKWTVQSGEPIEGIDTLNDLIVLQPQAVKIFTKFVKAADPSDYLPWVRNSVEMEPIIRKAPSKPPIKPDWHPAQDCSWNVFEVNGQACADLEGTLPDFSKFSASFIFEKQQLFMDWKATTGYGTAPFEKLALGEGDPSEIRGWLLTASFYTAVFPEADFVSFQLLSPNKREPIWCYARRGTLESQSLTTLFPHGQIIEERAPPQKVTLMLERGAAEGLPNQWLVGKLLHKQWISP